MELTTSLNLFYRYLSFLIVSIVFSLIFFACAQEPQIWETKSNEQVATDYIASQPEKFSEFSKLIEEAGLSSLLRVRGPYTILLPNNDAMFEYYKLKNVNSLLDLTPEFLNKLARNHIISNIVVTGDIGLGAIRDTNAIGDNIATEFIGSDIILNKYAKIIDRDVDLANGFIHVIDHVLDPLSKNVFEVLADNPGLSIFTEGLRRTGIKDTLSLIGAEYGKWIERTRFTVLAVPDTLYNRMGIYTVEDLIEKYTTPEERGDDDLKNFNNGFYRYMEYHCINGTNYLSDFNTNLYAILSVDNYISVTIDDDYKINYNSKTKEYTSFYIDQSNVPSKNGAIHVINDLLPVVSPERMTITMEPTDFFEFRRGDFYGKYYKKWFDGQNSFNKIVFEGDFLGYYYKTHNIPTPLLNYDALFMFGFWWVEITFPKVPKGNYKIVYGSPWTGTADFSIYIDGKQSNIMYDGQTGGNQEIADVNFETTAEHKIKIASTVYGPLYWDFIQFVPVN